MKQENKQTEQSNKRILAKRICLIVGMSAASILCLIAFINPWNFSFGNFVINIAFMLVFLALGVLSITFAVKPNKTLLLGLISIFPVLVFMAFWTSMLIMYTQGAPYGTIQFLAMTILMFSSPMMLIFGIISIIVGIRRLSQKSKHDAAGIILSGISLLIIIGVFLFFIISWLIIS